MFFENSKKAISAVVAISLFLVVTIISVIAFQNWFLTFQSTQFVEVESKSSNFADLNIVKIIGGKLYISSESNVSVSKVQINSRDCWLDPSLTAGVNPVNVENCLAGMNNGKLDVVLVTDEKVISDEFYSDSDYELPLFSKVFDGGSADDKGDSLIQTSTGDYGLFGLTDNDNYWLIKTDKYGNAIRNVSFDRGYGLDYGESLIETRDGGFGLLGRSRNVSGYDMWLIKTDSSGSELWNKVFDNGFNNYGASLIELDDGSFVLLGMTDNGPDWDFWLIKTNSSGGELWNVSFDGGGYDNAFSVIETSDGGLGLLGWGQSGGVGYDFWLIKTDDSGNVLWNVSFDGGNGNDRGVSLIELRNGGFGLLGFVDNGLDRDVWLIKTNNSGGEIWNVSFSGGNGDDEGTSLVETFDYGLALFGYKNNGVDDDMWLIKTDSSGNELWNVSFDGENGEDRGYSVTGMSYNGFGLLGSRNNGVDNDFWFIKTNSTGGTCDYTGDGIC